MRPLVALVAALAPALLALACADAPFPDAADPRAVTPCWLCPTPLAGDFRRVAHVAGRLESLAVRSDGRALLAIRTVRLSGKDLADLPPYRRRSDVIAVDLATGGTTSLFTAPSGALGSPAWVADGSAFTALWAPYRQRTRWVRHAVTDGGSPGGELVLLGDRAVTQLGAVAFAPDGARFVGKSGDLLVLGALGRADLTVLGSGADATWSPDGQRIAFGRVPHPGVLDMEQKQQILVQVASAGAVPTPLTSPTENAGCPAFSPDGRSLAFLSYGPLVHDDDAEWRVNDLTLVVEGSAQRWKLTDGAARCACPAWSPDGWLYVACADGPHRDGLVPATDVYRLHPAPAGPLRPR
jgi:dipeptidyl aminopeptidase/acylaminoacyl peptidase